MKRSFCALAIALALLLSAIPPPASAFVLTRTTFNNNSDTWVWVTAYNSKGDHANGPTFCLAPGQERIVEWNDFISRMRFEFTSSAGCSHPVRADISERFAVIRFYLEGNKGSGYRVKWAACHGDNKHCFYYKK